MSFAIPAPIALFAYRRPRHVHKTLSALVQSAGFEPGRLHVFCDGPKSREDEAEVAETRKVIRSFALRGARVVEREENRGLATSIIDGVTELCRACGAVIVLEDDLVVGHYFLQFMDRALQRYVGDERVLQVNGYVFPTPLRIPADAFFLPFVGSWGWATWDRSWRLFDPNLGGYGRLMASRQDRRRFDLEGAYPFVRLLERQRAGVVDSWAIRWYLTVFLLGGLALYPRRSLVQNIGLDGTGAHWKARDPAMMGELFTGELVTFPDRVEIDQVGYAAVVAFLRRYSNPLRKALRRIRLRFLC